MPPPADAIIAANPDDREARRRADAAFDLLARSRKPLLLFVTHARGGGVARHVRELASLLAADADVLVLRAHRRSYLALEGEGGNRDARLWFHRDDDWADLVAFLCSLGVTRVHYHHVQALPQRVLGLGREIGCAWDVTVHDYYPVCPQYQLTDASGRYCGEPDEAGCTRCLAANPAQWPIRIAAWRAAFETLLREAARVIAPSRDAADRIARYFPAVSPLVWPHWDDIAAPPGDVKVLVLGGLSPAKGMALLEACAREARERKLPLRFRVIGHIALPLEDGEDMRLSFTGEYPEGMLPTLIEQERGDAILFPAQWPETYSYTLTAAIESGLPIVATDLGAFRERLEKLDRARLLPWNASAARFADALLEVAPRIPRQGQKSSAAPASADSYRARYLQGIAEKPVLPRPAEAGHGGHATAPDESMPEATLTQLFDDGVRCGNGRSTALLRERVARADRELEDAAALRERAAAAEAARAEARTGSAVLEEALVACREENARLAAAQRTASERAAEFESSTSWRITAPLRALARLLRG
jgi:glycosyltransferase involved in cell wall biosynthesis